MFPSLIENVASRASDFGLSVIEHRPTCSCALPFDYGLKVRPFFPKLIEPMEMRLDAMSSQGVDHQVLSAWADIFAHGMPRQNAVAWHNYLNNHLAKVCELRPERFSWLASVPFPFAQESAAELERAVIKLGAVGAVIAANVEGTILGNLTWTRSGARRWSLTWAYLFTLCRRNLIRVRRSLPCPRSPSTPSTPPSRSDH
jgi:aminocarboxymuconate-semialdehyde decarboxylase